MSAPLALTLHEGQLLVRWPAHDVLFAAPVLREACRCAICSARAKRGAPVEAPSDLRVIAVSQLGAYGAQLTFSDGHDRGIFPWSLLCTLAGED